MPRPARQPAPAARPRSAGVLLHVTSLPGPFGVGDLGPEAYRWVDTLAAAGQSWWQVLPLNPPGKGDSPYQAYSRLRRQPAAGQPRAAGQGRAAQAVGDRRPRPAAGTGRLRRRRRPQGRPARPGLGPVLHRRGKLKPLLSEFARFRRDQADWLDEYTLYMALRDAHGDRPWGEWDPQARPPRPGRPGRGAAAQAERIDRHAFDQFLFARQWGQLKAYAADRGVRTIGDVPIFVSGDSADVWSRPELFLLDRQRRPTVVAGVPPDYFSKTGQRWGNPLYNWKAMAADDFGWWVARLRTLLAQTDLVRVDHFRGFAACWNVPAAEPTASTASGSRPRVRP